MASVLLARAPGRDPAMNGTTRPTTDPQEIERAINRVRGVQASRVQLGPGRQVQKVHAVATEERDPKQIVRDIESLLYALFRLSVDYRKISLVQLADAAPGAALARIRFISAAIRIDPAPRAIVTLRLGSRSSTAEAGLPEAVAGSLAQARLHADAIAQLAPAADLKARLAELAERISQRYALPLGVQATIAAVDGLLGRQLGARPIASRIARLNGDQALIVELEIAGGHSRQRVVGCALLAGPEQALEAVCQATLDALNRHVSATPPLRDESIEEKY